MRFVFQKTVPFVFDTETARAKWPARLDSYVLYESTKGNFFLVKGDASSATVITNEEAAAWMLEQCIELPDHLKEFEETMLE